MNHEWQSERQVVKNHISKTSIQYQEVISLLDDNKTSMKLILNTSGKDFFGIFWKLVKKNKTLTQGVF